MRDDGTVVTFQFLLGRFSFVIFLLWLSLVGMVGSRSWLQVVCGNVQAGPTGGLDLYFRGR